MRPSGDTNIGDVRNDLNRFHPSVPGAMKHRERFFLSLIFCLAAAALSTSRCALAQSYDDGSLTAAATRAFPLTAHIIADRSAVITWSIRPTFQIYRDSIKVRSISDGVQVGALTLPSGVREDDPYLGPVSILTGHIHASFPYQIANGASPSMLHFAVTFRGCHTAAPQFCFPPITTIVNVPVTQAGRGPPS